MNPWDLPTVEPSDLPDGAVVLDVREDEEWRAGHIDGAVHVPMHLLPNRLAYEPGELTPEAPIVVVCRSGNRSAHVTAWLNQQGFDAVNLDGGMVNWLYSGKPMVCDEGEPFVL